MKKNEKKTDLNKIILTKELIETIKCERSFKYFVRKAWHIIDSATYLHSWHIDAICDHLQAVYDRKITRLIVNLPPGFAKSIIISCLYPVWVWINDQSHRFLTGSYSEKYAVRDTLKSRNIINSEWFQSKWGSRFSLASDQNVKSYYLNNKHGYRIAFSTGGSTTGARADTIIFDDPLNWKDADSDLKCEGTNQFVDQALSTRDNMILAHIKPTAIILVQQRFGHRDQTGHLLSKENKWVHLYFPFEFEPENRCETLFFIDPRTIKDEPLVSWIPPEKIKEKKIELGSRAWMAQFQQRPISDEGNLFKRDWWQYILRKDLPSGMRIIQGWDCANKAGRENDYSVCLTIGKLGDKFYLLDLFRRKMEYVDLRRAFLEHAEKHKAVTIYIEDKVNGSALLSDLRTTKYAHIIKAINPTLDKVARARPTTAVAEAANFFILDDNDFKEKKEIFLAEMSSFPNGNYKDIVDTYSMIINNERVKAPEPYLVWF